MINAQLPKLPQLKSDGTFDTPAVQMFLENILKVLDNHSKSDGSVKDVFPIGHIYLSVVNENPCKWFVGTWEVFGTGKTLVGVDASQTEFNAIEKTGGEIYHQLTIPELPAHTHGVWTPWNSGSAGLTAGSMTQVGIYAPSQSTGSGIAHNNLQPYITVYMWKRVK